MNLPSWIRERWGGHKTETSDLPSFYVYAKNIADEVASNFEQEEGDGYVFAISGRWGAGKTKLLRLIGQLLQPRGYEVVTFNAWQYTQDQDTLRRAFLKNLYTDLHKSLGDRLKSRKRLLRRLDFEQTQTSIWLPPLWVFVVVLLVLGCLALVDAETTISIYGWLGERLSRVVNYVNEHPAASTFIAVTAAIFALPKILHIQKKSTKISSIDEFETLFDQIVKAHKKLVIYIDDLDRCTPEGAKLVLDALKTFFLKSHVSYIVTGDHTVLERYMGDQLEVSPIYNEDGTVNQKQTNIEKKLEGQRFMQKIFNVYWKLPVLEPSEFELLIDKGLGDIELLTDTDRRVVKTILIAYLERTPREVKRFSSLLNFSLQTISSRLSLLKAEKDNTSMRIAENLQQVLTRPALLAKLLLMQEKFDAAFDYYSAMPRKYKVLERRVLTNGEQVDAKELQERLGNNYPRFIDFVKTAPTFYTQNGKKLLTSPEVFFYHSGFTGSNQTGIISEDFLLRYIVPDENLTSDFSDTQPKSDRDKILESAISNITQVTDTTQLTYAISHLISIFEQKQLGHSDLFIDLVKHEGLLRLWNTADAGERQNILTRLLKLADAYQNATVFDFLVKNDPWIREVNATWQHFDFSVLDETLISIVVDYINELGATAEAEQIERQFYEQNLKTLCHPNEYSVEALKIAAQRLIEDVFNLGLQKFANEDTFNQLAVALSNIDSTKDVNKAQILLDSLLKQHPIWQSVSRPRKVFSFKKKTRMEQLYKKKARDIFESWR